MIGEDSFVSLRILPYPAGNSGNQTGVYNLIQANATLYE